MNITLGKGLKFGIDFTGGTFIRLKFREPITTEEIRARLTPKGLGNSIIQEIERGHKEYQIRTAGLIKRGEEKPEEIETHVVIGNMVVEALQKPEDAAQIAKGFKDLNSVDQKELINLLLPTFPEEAEEAAKKIIALRDEKGIIDTFEDLRQIGLKQEIIKYLQEKCFLGSLCVLSRETVGPQAGKELRRKAILATVWALIGMLVYIALRFKLAYGVAGVLTLAHDVLVTLSIYSFTDREINLPIIAAILTLVGYSINDTIVIFDRVRENLKILRKLPLEELMNISINQTLSRTVLTAGTTLVAVLFLFLFGGKVINDFAFTLLIGLIIGTYSSVYQSCPLVLYWHKIFQPKKRLK
ncbi:MAG: protein translocase subunit SecF [Candidatus Aminicenantes bacterium]|nr:protein translocase subunit SecF [Candidatus Aminicenantes bacterium]